MDFLGLILKYLFLFVVVLLFYLFCKRKLENIFTINNRIKEINSVRVQSTMAVFLTSTCFMYAIGEDFGIKMAPVFFRGDFYRILFFTFFLSLAFGFIVLDRILPKSFICPHCPQAIFFYSDWKCQSCGAVNKGRLITAKCEKCGNKLTALKCPNCNEKIEFDKVYDEKK